MSNARYILSSLLLATASNLYAMADDTTIEVRTWTTPAGGNCTTCNNPKEVYGFEEDAEVGDLEWGRITVFANTNDSNDNDNFEWTYLWPSSVPSYPIDAGGWDYVAIGGIDHTWDYSVQAFETGSGDIGIAFHVHSSTPEITAFEIELPFMVAVDHAAGGEGTSGTGPGVAAYLVTDDVPARTTRTDADAIEVLLFEPVTIEGTEVASDHDVFERIRIEVDPETPLRKDDIISIAFDLDRVHYASSDDEGPVEWNELTWTPNVDSDISARDIGLQLCAGDRTVQSNSSTWASFDQPYDQIVFDAEPLDSGHYRGSHKIDLTDAEGDPMMGVLFGTTVIRSCTFRLSRLAEYIPDEAQWFIEVENTATGVRSELSVDEITARSGALEIFGAWLGGWGSSFEFPRAWMGHEYQDGILTIAELNWQDDQAIDLFDQIDGTRNVAGVWNRVRYRVRNITAEQASELPSFDGVKYSVQAGCALLSRLEPLDSESESPGDLDECADALPIGPGTWSCDTRQATTGAPYNDFTACENFGQSGMLNDIWYRYQPVESGTVIASGCGTLDWDSRIAIYRGDDCSDLVLVSCNDDASGCSGYTSSAQADVVGGSTYFIRVGAYDGADRGIGSIQLSGPESHPGSRCAADLDGDGLVDGADLTMLLASWGGESPDGDIDGDGSVDGADLTELLASWGACP